MQRKGQFMSVYIHLETERASVKKAKQNFLFGRSFQKD